MWPGMFQTVEEVALVYDKATLKMREAHTFLCFFLHAVVEVLSQELKTNYINPLAFNFLTP